MRSSRRPFFAACVLSIACSSTEEPAPTASLEELRDPLTCSGCHEEHYREWAGSMHAYASTDPVFLAMNARGQRETNGALGDFCVRCHAPMAVELGATTDGLNLSELPSSLQGVGCYFCHNVESVDGAHNNPLRLAHDTTLRGALRDPAPNGVHAVAYSPFTDRDRLESAALCGACHDVVTPAPPAPVSVHLERTFAEWQTTVFNQPPAAGGLTCGGCHMRGRDGRAAIGGPATRRVHGHDFPGVDVALTPFPDRERQRALVQQELDATLRAEVCVLPGGIELLLENIGAGHRFPSGASQDRRLWVELVAYRQGEVVFESGVVADDRAVEADADTDLWLLYDRTSKLDGSEAHMFWDVATIERHTLPGPVTLDRADPAFFETHVTRRYPSAGTIEVVPDRVTVRVRLRPIGRAVLEDLVASGDLDPGLLQEQPTFDLVPDRRVSPFTLEWSREIFEGRGFVRRVDGVLAECVGNAAELP